MVKMSLGKIRGGAFNQALEKLMTQPGVPVATSLELRRLAKRIGTEIKHFDAEQKKLAMQFCELEDGEPKVTPNPNGTASYVFLPGKKAAYQDKYIDLHDHEIELDRISPERLGDAINNLTAADLYQLEFIDEEEPQAAPSRAKTKLAK